MCVVCGMIGEVLHVCGVIGEVLRVCGVVDTFCEVIFYCPVQRKAAAILRLNQVDATELKRKRLMDRVQQSRAAL